jgi:hypothetical protein
MLRRIMTAGLDRYIPVLVRDCPSGCILGSTSGDKLSGRSPLRGGPVGKVRNSFSPPRAGWRHDPLPSSPFPGEGSKRHRPSDTTSDGWTPTEPQRPSPGKGEDGRGSRTRGPIRLHAKVARMRRAVFSEAWSSLCSGASVARAARAIQAPGFESRWRPPR